MGMENQTIITEVILQGFSTDLKINIALFLLFLTIYLITIIGNFLIICTVLMNARLHLPMYFFLCNLSFIDFCYSSTAVPRLLSDLFTLHRTISNRACGIQLYIILFMGGTECQLLVLMAYDRFVAICWPLHYPVMMRWSVCYRLTAFVWIFSFMIYIFPSLVMPISLCNRNQINHFMCELVAVIKLSCGDIYLNELVIFCISFISLLLPFLFILISYICIISSVLKVRTAGKYKAFSTCTSHIIVVVLYFGTGMITYFGPSSLYASNQEKYISVFYVAVCPMLNPLIYSLNNREVRKSFRTLFTKHIVSSSIMN
ncbi:olfactory receptor-like protein OLF3 [Hyla sarda]|uniref:olfactory receptor-like protein OLF3 n=1 Tax=Hyla sarda TaxID=327740 RepID=UPI0024C2FB8C|nr:olfactory receptor-like protein OLF3 [Hyla sarda]